MQNLWSYSLVYTFQWILSFCSTKCIYSSNCDFFIIAIEHYLRHLEFWDMYFSLKREPQSLGSLLEHSFGLFHPILIQHIVCYFSDLTSITLWNKQHQLGAKFELPLSIITLRQRIFKNKIFYIDPPSHEKFP